MADKLIELQKQFDDLRTKHNALNLDRKEKLDASFNLIKPLTDEIEVVAREIFAIDFKEKYDEITNLVNEKFPTIQFEYKYDHKRISFSDAKWLFLIFSDTRDTITYKQIFEFTFNEIYESFDIFYDELINKLTEYDDFYEAISKIKYQNLKMTKFEFSDDLNIKNYNVSVDFGYDDSPLTTITMPEIGIKGLDLEIDNQIKLDYKLRDAVNESELFKRITFGIYDFNEIYGHLQISPRFYYADEELFNLLLTDNNLVKLIELIVKTTDEFLQENNL